MKPLPVRTARVLLTGSRRSRIPASGIRRRGLICGTRPGGLLLGAAAVVLLAGHATASPISTAVSVEPQAFFVERIGGPEAAVQVLVGAGQCAETYEPTAKQVARLAGVQVYFAIGMPMEETLLPRLRANVPGIAIVEMRAGIPPRALEEREAAGGGESGEATVHTEPLVDRDAGKHLHAGEDPHVWLNPQYARILAASVAAALERVDPGHAAAFRERLAALEAELDALAAEVAETLAPVRGRSLIADHPFYGYLADAYGLRQAPIESGGFKPGSKHLARLVEQARKEGVRAVFVQEGASAASAETVAREIGARVVALDPMSRDYAVNLRRMARRIRDGLLGE